MLSVRRGLAPPLLPVDSYTRGPRPSRNCHYTYVIHHSFASGLYAASALYRWAPFLGGAPVCLCILCARELWPALVRHDACPVTTCVTPGRALVTGPFIHENTRRGPSDPASVGRRASDCSASRTPGAWSPPCSRRRGIGSPCWHCPDCVAPVVLRGCLPSYHQQMWTSL